MDMQAINAMRERINIDTATAERRLESLRRDFPALLAGNLFGEVTDHEVGRVRDEIAEIEQRQREFPLALEGLNQLTDRANAEATKARKRQQLEREEARFASAVAEFKQMAAHGEYNRDAESKVIIAGNATGRSAEAERIIWEAERTRKNYRPGREWE